MAVENDDENIEEIEEIGELEETPSPDDEGAEEGLLAVEGNNPFLKSSFPVVFLNRDMRILFSNDAASRLFEGYFKLRGRYFMDVFAHAFELSDIQEIREAIVEGVNGQSWKGEARIKAKHVTSMQVKVYVFPLDFSSPDKDTFIVMFDDVTEENRTLLRSVFMSLLEASKLKDNDTGKHIVRVSFYTRRMAEKLIKCDNIRYNRVDADFVENIGFLSSMHDVGKIGTPDDILNKEGPLSDWEWTVMREHTKNGAFILSTYPHPMAKEIALSHHERWDGAGYPYQLSGEMIPLAARITTIADVYDALRMERSYKKAFSHEVTIEKMFEGRDSHFDPFLTDIFMAHHDEFERIFNEHRDD